MTDGSGLAIGMGTGLAIGAMLAESEKEKGMRQSHIGKDQVLIRIKAKKEEVLNTLAKTFDNWYISGRDGGLYRKSNTLFEWTTAIVGFILTGLVSGIAEVIWWSFQPGAWSWNSSNPYNPWVFGAIVGGIVFVILGFSGARDTRIDYIRVKGDGDYTTTLLKIYDSEGYRNLDEDDLHLILKQLDTVFKDRIIK